MNKHIEEMAKELSGYLAGVDIERAREILTSIYQRGREDLQKEIAHEQRKLLDGFAHPKDCPQCSPLPEYPRE